MGIDVATQSGPALAGTGVQKPAFHARSRAELFEDFGSGAAGLTASEAEARLRRSGPNALPAPRRRSLLVVVLSQLKSPLIYLLLAAAAVSILLGERDDALFIFIVLAINTAIGAVQEWRAEASTAALRSAITMTVRVRRDRTVQRLDSTALVPGDVVLLEAGDRVPADLRLLESADLQADESSLTGESLPVDKAAGGALPADTVLADRINMLHAGSTLQRGRCEALVVATGMATELGRIAEKLEEPAAAPPLTQRLDRFTRALGFIALAMVAAVVAIQLAAGASLHETFFVAVALAVSAIPEGLPVAVTVALSVATSRMARRNVIIRHLPAVEGLGACTVIATDKTGTLTVNQLTARRVWLPGHGIVDVGGAGWELEGGFAGAGGPLSDHAHADLAALAGSSALTNAATLDPRLGAAGRSGDTVDLAFLVLAFKAGLDPEDLRAARPRLAELPFSAERKLAASLHRQAGEHRLHVKGAADVLIPLCAGTDRDTAAAAAESMAAAGFRVLAVASKSVAVDAAARLESELEELTLLGLVGFIDPLRPEARDAVAACHSAGVDVKMITGDHAATALAIARDLGIADRPAEVVTGRELTELAAHRPAELAPRVAAARVFARVEPAQKVQIVELLQSSRQIVAMTGDGVNDAPALRRADLGVAMGRDGTDVAREAADLVLTDDNFASVVAGIEEGRAAYANIRKVIYLLISTGAAEVVLFFLAILSGLPVPLTAVQLLWLNLVTNGGQDVALAFEGREPGLMRQRPRDPAAPIFDARMISETAVSGVYVGLVGYLVFWLLLDHGFSEFEARNILLFLLVGFENAHVFDCRSEWRSAFRVPLSANWPVVGAVVLAQAVHVGAAFTPGIREVLQIEPISLSLWLLLVPVACSVILVMEVEKLLWRRRAATAAAG